MGRFLPSGHQSLIINQQALSIKHILVYISSSLNTFGINP
jgi:hypothetical protein